MACCLTAPSHYLNKCWLIISKVLCHSSEHLIKSSFEGTNQQSKLEASLLENCIFKVASKSPRGQWVNCLEYTHSKGEDESARASMRETACERVSKRKSSMKQQNQNVCIIYCNIGSLASLLITTPLLPEPILTSQPWVNKTNVLGHECFSVVLEERLLECKYTRYIELTRHQQCQGIVPAPTPTFWEYSMGMSP